MNEILFACSNFYKSTATVTHFSGDLYDVTFEIVSGTHNRKLVTGLDVAINFAMWLAS